ncbi:hypothetical protein JNUCC74_14670 [Cerasibacillus sp. JNUCC 74]
MNNEKPKNLEKFDQEVYARTSDNNMPIFGKAEPLTDEERKQLESAISF